MYSANHFLYDRIKLCLVSKLCSFSYMYVMSTCHIAGHLHCYVGMMFFRKKVYDMLARLNRNFSDIRELDLNPLGELYGHESEKVLEHRWMIVCRVVRIRKKIITIIQYRVLSSLLTSLRNKSRTMYLLVK